MKVIRIEDVIINLERVEYIEQFPVDKKANTVTFGFHLFENKYVAVSVDKVIASSVLSICLQEMRGD